MAKGVPVRQFKEQLLKEVSLQRLPFDLNIERQEGWGGWGGGWWHYVT